MRTAMRRVIELATELNQAIRELDIEIDYHNQLVRNITNNIKEIHESEKTNNKI